ncbi:MAG: hypothetical protein LBC67_04185 [Spirochaetales bacterium]|nr:hypothetical protein [Spirochaetales bacterium]
MEEVVEQLKALNEKVAEVISILKNPGNRLIKIFEVGAAIVTVVGVISIIDTIRKWTGG